MPAEAVAPRDLNISNASEHNPSAVEYAPESKAAQNYSQSANSKSSYSTDSKSNFQDLVDKGLGVAKSVVGGLFSLTGLSCATEFKPTADSWDDFEEIDSPADEVEFLDVPEDSDADVLDGLDAEEEPSTIVCEKIGTDVRVTNDSALSQRPSLVWTGSEYGMGFEDERDGNREIYFGRISPVGLIIDSGTRLTDATALSIHPSLSWNGSQFGFIWYDGRSSTDEILFRRVSPIGELIGSEIPVTSDGYSRDPSLAWTGSGYGTTWYDDRNGNWEIFFALISQEGAPLTTNIRVTNDTSNSRSPSIVWTGSEFGVTWYGDRDGNDEIYFRRISNIGDLVEDLVRVSSGDENSHYPSLVWTGSEYGIAWHDFRDGNGEIYFARLSEIGALMASDIRITNDSANSSSPSLVWNGSEFAFSWSDDRFDANSEIFFRRMAGDGSLIDDELRITGAFGNSEHPSLAWTGSEYGFTWDDDRDGNEEVYFARVGCHPE